MNLKIQHIGKLLPLLAGLIIFAHAVVPHHHHFGFTNTATQETTCKRTAHDNKTEDSDMHCCAFNLLISEQSTHALFTKSLSEKFNLHGAVIITNVEISPVINFVPTIFDYQYSLTEKFFFTAHSLRGPPAIA